MKKLFPIILLTFVNTLSFSILLPILPFIIERYSSSNIAYGLLLSAFSLSQFIGSSWLGSLSDQWGRRNVLIISQLGTLLSWMLFGCGFLFSGNTTLLFVPVALIIFFLARTLDGITGGNSSVADAYVSDVTAQKERAYSFSIMAAVFGFGMMVGPAIGSMTAATPFGFGGTVLFEIALSIVTLIGLVVGLKETLSVEKRLQKSRAWWKKINVFATLAQHRHTPCFPLLMGKLFFSITMAGYTSVIVLYMIDTFMLNAIDVGYVFLLIGSYSIVSQLLLLPVLLKRFSVLHLMIAAQFCMGAGLILITLPHDVWVFAALYYVAHLGISLTIPTVKSLLTSNVAEDKRGEILGLDESLLSLSMGVVPLFSTMLYEYTFEYVFAIWAMVALGNGLFLLKHALRVRQVLR